MKKHYIQKNILKIIKTFITDIKQKDSIKKIKLELINLLKIDLNELNKYKFLYKMKTIYFVRHGYAYQFFILKIGKQAYDIRDTQLLQKVEQASHLGDTWEDKNKIDLVICSPSMNLDTALMIFKDTNYKIVASDLILEYLKAAKNVIEEKINSFVSLISSS